MLQVFQSYQVTDPVCEQKNPRYKCVDGKDNSKFFKSNSTDYKICPGCVSCFERGSEVYLNTHAILGFVYLKTLATLNVLNNATLSVVDMSTCTIKGGSSLTVAGSLKMKSAILFIDNCSTVFNYGIIELNGTGWLSVFNVVSSNIENYGKIQQDKSFYIGFIDSFAKMSNKGQMLIGPYCIIRVESHSVFELNYEYDLLIIKQQSLIMKSEAKLYVSELSTFRILSGQVVMEKSDLYVEHQGSCEVDGFLQIKNTMVFVVGKLYVGYSKDGARGEANSSLIIASSLLIKVENLIVHKGAHCLITKFFEADINLVLKSNSTGEFFRCFSSRADLIASFE